jgi:hypothetical protein
VTRSLAAASAVLAVGAVLGLTTACGGASGGGSRISEAPFGKTAAATARIEARDADGRPRLTLVDRDGDPSPGLSVAVVTGAGGRVTLDLALVVEDRLQAAGVTVARRVDRDAFFMSTYLGTGDVRFFELVRAALAAPIAEAELARAEAHVAALGPLPTEPAELAEVHRCVGRLAVRDERAPQLADVENARKAAFARRRAAFALVGPASVAEGAEKAWLASAAWPEGASFQPAPPTAPAEVGRSVALGRGSARIEIALGVGDARQAAAAAEDIGRPSSPLRAKLSRLPVPFSLDEIGGVAQPQGGCLYITATSRSGDAGGDLPLAVAQAAGVAEAELAWAVSGPLDEGAATRQVTGATDAAQASTIAAWWSLSTPRDAKAPVVAAALFDAEAADATLAAARDKLARPPSPARIPSKVESRVEAGQGEMWIALGDACALVEEAPHLWGTASLVALSASLESPEIDGVSIEPMIDPHGVGIFAHARPRRGEAPEELADRVASAGAAALLGRPLTSDGLVEAQSRARAELERRWGHETVGLAPFAQALSPEHPVLVEPLGSFAEVSRADADRFVRRWRAFGSGGIELGVLANVNAAQAKRASEVVGRWLVGTGGAGSCQRSTPAPRPSRTEVHGSGTSHSAWVLFGAPVADPGLAETARVLLDGRTQASLSRAALASVPGATARAWVSDGGALVVTVQVSDELSDPAEKAMTALVAKLAKGDVPEATLRDAARAAEEDARRELADPRTRLRLLLSGGKLEAPVLGGADVVAKFKAFGASTLGADRWIVVVAHPG